MPSLNRPAKACELASFSLNKTGPAPWAVFSDIRYASHTHNLISRGCPPCLGPARHTCRHSFRACAATAETSVRGHNRAFGRATKKGAAVAGGSKVITGRRQTEWTGATRRPEAGRFQ